MRLLAYLIDGARRWLSIARLAGRAGLGPVAAAVCLNLLLGLLPIGLIVATSAMIARVATGPAAGSADLPAPLLALGGVLATLTLQNMLSPLQAAVGELIAVRVDGHRTRRLMRAAMAAPMTTVERPDVVDALAAARADLTERMGTPGAAFAGMVALAARYTQLIGALVLVAVVVGPLAGGVLGCVAFAARFGNRSSLRRWWAISKSLHPARRRWRYVVDTGCATSAAKDMRVLGLLRWFTARAEDESRSILLPLWRHRRRVYFAPFVLLTAVVLAGVCLVMVQLVTAVGEGMSVFAVSLAIQSVLVATLFGVFFPESDIQTQAGSETIANLDRLERVCAAAPDRSAGHRLPGGRPVPVGAGVRFENVFFRYPAYPRHVLSGLRLELPAGTSTAIVGLNGAGKTTLIKLLTGLYEPTAGRVTVGGIDLRELDPACWRRNLAVMFQDYLRYELDLAANVTMGAPHRPRDERAVRDALRWADGEHLATALPRGLDTPLSADYAGGVDLSGGEWQRVALARAGYAVAGGASILVLDEPTAHLDARAEVVFFDRFLHLTRGLTTVVISHRFSTVRRADRIVVLADGRLVEDGSHDELVRRDGRYARLFRLQAGRFREDGRLTREGTS